MRYNVFIRDGPRALRAAGLQVHGRSAEFAIGVAAEILGLNENLIHVEAEA